MKITNRISGVLQWAETLLQAMREFEVHAVSHPANWPQLPRIRQAAVSLEQALAKCETPYPEDVMRGSSPIRVSQPVDSNLFMAVSGIHSLCCEILRGSDIRTMAAHTARLDVLVTMLRSATERTDA